MKSSIAYKLAPHQILSFANEESEILMTFIEQGSLIFGIIIGLILCLVACIILLPPHGMLPFLGIIGLFIIVVGLSKISSLYYHKSRFYAAKKLTAIENFCLNFQNLMCLEYLENAERQFNTFLDKQYQNMLWSDVYSNKYSGIGTAVILLGGLLNFCESKKDTEIPKPDSILILIIFYVVFVKNLFLEYCNAVDAIIRGKASLEKFKNTYFLNDSSPSLVRSEGHSLVTIQDAEFEWEKPNIYSVAALNKINQQKSQISQPSDFKLSVMHFKVPRRTVIGIAGSPGSGKSTLLYTISGHTTLLAGSIKQKGKYAIFPKKPFLKMGSIKSNVLMECDELDSNLYYRAITTVKLNEDLNVALDNENMTVNMLELDELAIERIIMARAIYTKSELLIFDDPFNYILQHNVAMFHDILNIMKINKTLVIASNNEEILRLCDNVYYMMNGSVYREGTHADLISIPSYSKMLKDYRAMKRGDG